MIRTNDDPVAALLTVAVHVGDLALLRRLLDENPGLATDEIRGPRGDGTRTMLMITADWPGYWPEAPEAVRMLIAAGADPSARGQGSGRLESPLHWAASSDDVHVAEALIDGGADIDAPDGSIGTPLANAVGYGCWDVARLLVARGARVGSLWQAAALGLQSVVDEMMSADPPPSEEEISHALYQACSGGQLRMAAYLLAKGADINYSPDYAGDSTAIDAAAGDGTRRGILVDWLRERGGVSGETRDSGAGETGLSRPDQ